MISLDPPRWRGDDGRRLPFRDAIRARLPVAADGFVALDLDLITRAYGPSYGLDDAGRFRLVEVKCAVGGLTGAQWHTFRLIDSLLAGAERFDGFYVVWTETEEWHECERFVVQRIRDGRHVDIGPDKFWPWLGFGRVRS